MRMERVVGLSLVLALAMLAGVYSDSQPDCSSQLAALAPCLPFVQGQTNTADTGCCVALNTAHKTSPACLCQLIASKTPIPGVNLTKAEQLPALCNITDADPSKCGISGPSTAPVLQLQLVEPQKLTAPEALHQALGKIVLHQQCCHLR
ncbi:hypothetical protein O6H91_23G064900 [Diphasiastrum complanatum]|uniref:Uncharacterized protein n=1 Tax=Diphasiastrum complanatum TaxID=34168 RepID=A0ACC2ABE0_DIPCM|nr:hypothetical protein O6H91_23G064900 [Diphasiastrum complanatum]